MKKILSIIVLGLLWCDFGFAETKIYPNGEKYIGEFKNGKFDGKGLRIWADGDAEYQYMRNDELTRRVYSDY